MPTFILSNEQQTSSTFIILKFTVSVVTTLTSQLEASQEVKTQEALYLYLHPSQRDRVNIELRSSVLETVDTVVVTQID